MDQACDKCLYAGIKHVERNWDENDIVFDAALSTWGIKVAELGGLNDSAQNCPKHLFNAWFKDWETEN
jgi:hypothetical protein